jgi:tRNA wybutosine-synthesizing protein 2
VDIIGGSASSRSVPTLRVPKESATGLIAELRRARALDTTRRPAAEGGFLLVPVQAVPPPPFDPAAFGAEAVAAVLVRSPRPAEPMESIRSMAGKIAGLDPRLLPRRWELVGDVLVLRVPPALRPYLGELLPIYARVLGARTVLEDVAGVQGPWRLPQVRWLWGGGTETVHRENRVRFKLDVAAVMFSSGNLDERVRMAGVPRAGETVVDLFAGIGYFAVPMAVHSKAARVVACEANPTAFHYLEENVRINRAARAEPRLGDCRVVAPEGIADRIVMGHFEAEEYLDTAFRAARDRATVHLHGLVRDRWTPRPPLMQRLYLEAARHGFVVASSRLRRVKSCGPRVWHAVVDADVARG